MPPRVHALHRCAQVVCRSGCPPLARPCSAVRASIGPPGCAIAPSHDFASNHSTTAMTVLASIPQPSLILFCTVCIGLIKRGLRNLGRSMHRGMCLWHGAEGREHPYKPHTACTVWGVTIFRTEYKSARQMYCWGNGVHVCASLPVSNLAPFVKVRYHVRKDDRSGHRRRVVALEPGGDRAPLVGEAVHRDHRAPRSSP